MHCKLRLPRVLARRAPIAMERYGALWSGVWVLDRVRSYRTLNQHPGGRRHGITQQCRWSGVLPGPD
jgi:hypothetical protein